MRIFSMILAVVLMTLIATDVLAAPAPREPSASGKYTCKIVTGYGTAIGQGSTALEAKAVARETCGTNMIDDYLARRGRIDPSAIDDLALACVNLECE